jgi:hypothetical protein
MPDEITNTAPQLSPIQQQFVETLGSAPTNAVPFSAGPGLQGFSAPGYAAGYQPAQSFDSPEYQKSLYEWEQQVRQQADTARAEQAVQAGIRYIYQQRYDADLKKGVPEPQAFSRMMLGMAMHTPKSDPVKVYDAFRNRPAPQGQMMQFGTNQVPVIVNTDKSGAQRATPVPASVLPQTPADIITRYDPTTKRHYQLRNNQWYPVTAEEAARLSPLEKAVEQGARKSMTAASEELQAQAKRTAPNTNRVAQATQQFQNASNTLQQLSVPKGAQPSPNEVTRVTKDGRKAIFDATTKKFLRYATD